MSAPLFGVRPVKTMLEFESVETADEVIAACVSVQDAMARAFDSSTSADGGYHPMCCGDACISTNFLGCGVRCRCPRCGAEIVNVLWPLGPLLYDSTQPNVCYTPSAELEARVGDRPWLVVRWPDRSSPAAQEGAS